MTQPSTARFGKGYNVDVVGVGHEVGRGWVGIENVGLADFVARLQLIVTKFRAVAGFTGGARCQFGGDGSGSG